MRDQFRSYYPLSTEERDKLWQDATIVFDTNALLDLYRYDSEAREVFMRVLEKQRERVWIPHQVGLEFQKNRLAIVSGIRGAFDKMRKSTESARTSLTGAIDELKRHPTIEAESLRAIVDEMFQKVVHHLDLARAAGSKQMPASDLDDAIWARVTEALRERVGAEPTADGLGAAYKEAQRRIDAEEPPGYKDREKPVPQRYGDYLVWSQILEHAAPDGSVIFVTGDRKDDWWRRHEGRHLGARIELLDEFYSRSTGTLAFYAPDEFLRFARDEFELGDVPERVLTNVEQVGRLEEESAKRELNDALTAFEKQIAFSATTLAEIDSHLEILGFPVGGSAYRRLDSYVGSRRLLSDQSNALLRRKQEIERRMMALDPADTEFDGLIDDRRDVDFGLEHIGEELAELDARSGFEVSGEGVNEFRRLKLARDMQWDRLREAERARMEVRSRIAAFGS